MEEGVYDINDDKNEKNYEEKEAECIYDTFSDDTEESLNDRNEKKMKNTMRKKRNMKQQILIAPQ